MEDTFETNKLVIIRGASGSGKTTCAMTHFAKYILVEADMYRFQGGEYVFDPKDNHTPHEWCFSRVKGLLEAGFPVVVANTFTKLWEMDRYLELYPNAKVVHCEGEYDNTHNVPLFAVERMRKSFEPYFG